MARIPRSDQGTSANGTRLPGSSGGGYSAVGEATQQLGSSIAKAGQSIGAAFEGAAAEDEQHQMFQAKLALTEFQGQQAAAQTEYDAGISGDGAGHVDTRIASYDQGYQKNLRNRFANAPEKVRQFIELGGAHLRNNALTSSTNAAVRQRGVYYAESATNVLQQQILPQISGDPKSLEMALQATDGVLGSIPDKRIAADLKQKMAKAIFEQWQNTAGPNAYAIAKEYTGQEIGDRKGGGAGSFATGQFDGVKGKTGTQSGASSHPTNILPRPPSHSERRAIFSKGGVVINLDTNSTTTPGQTSPMVVIPDNATPEQRQAAEAYASSIADLYKQQFGSSKSPRVVTRSQNGRGRPATIHTEPYAVTDANAVKFFSSPEGARAHAAILRDTFGKVPGAQFSIPHMPRKGDYGAEANGVNEVELAKLVLAELGGEAPPPDSRVADASGQTAPAIAQPASVRDYVTNMMARSLPALEKSSAIAAAKLRQEQLKQFEAQALDDLQNTDENGLAERAMQYDPGDPNDPAFPEKSALFNKLASRIGQIRTERATNPAESVANNPRVLEAKAALKPGDPESHQRYAMALVQAQEAVGIPNPRVIPKDMATAYWRKISGAHPNEFIPKLRELATEVSKMYGPYADKAFLNIISAGGSMSDDRSAISWGLLNKIRGGMPPTIVEMNKINSEADIMAINRASMATSYMDPQAKLGIEPFSQGAPPLGAIERLLANPQLARDFDEKFGEGSAAHVLIGEMPKEPPGPPDSVGAEGYQVDRLDFTNDAGKSPASPEDATVDEIRQQFPKFLEMMQEMIGVKPAAAAEGNTPLETGAGAMQAGAMQGEAPATMPAAEASEMQRMWDALPDRDKLNEWANVLDPDQTGADAPDATAFSKFFSPVRWPHLAAQTLANLPYAASDIQASLQRASHAIETGQEIAPEDSFILTTAPLLAGGVGGAGKAAGMMAKAGSRQGAAGALSLKNGYIQKDLPITDSYELEHIIRRLPPEERAALEANPNAVYHEFAYELGPDANTTGVVIGKTAWFDWFGKETGGQFERAANTVGRKGLFEMREQFRKDFPEVEWFMGKRVSGARKGKASDIDVYSKEGQDKLHQRMRIKGSTGTGPNTNTGEDDGK